MEEFPPSATRAPLWRLVEDAVLGLRWLASNTLMHAFMTLRDHLA
jgi:hypothetical protein